ncbi:MAG TPA: DUF6356 family protein [Casimicrobiaceae bacterium]|jgi:hypothetical protein
MANPFTAHPASVGETYHRHCRFALRFGARMTLGGLAAMAHGLFPFLFTSTGSRTLEALNAQLAGAIRAPGPPSGPVSDDE